jgi:hypothetical protein
MSVVLHINGAPHNLDATCPFSNAGRSKLPLPGKVLAALGRASGKDLQQQQQQQHMLLQLPHAAMCGQQLQKHVLLHHI